MKLRDKYGWPVTTFAGFHPITNLIRRLIHTNIRQTWARRNQVSNTPTPDPLNCICTEARDEHNRSNV